MRLEAQRLTGGVGEAVAMRISLIALRIELDETARWSPGPKTPLHRAAG
jgi:hypothetical protein